MSVHHKLISFLYRPHSLLKSIFNDNSNELRVILYHDIPEKEHQLFSKQLIWLKQYWNFVDPEDFCLMIRGEKPIVGKNLLITFDDGFYSNRQVAEFVLKPLNIKGIFFIVPKFIDLHNKSSLQDFVQSNIFPNSKSKYSHSTWQSMSWSDIEWLLCNGHTIGSHTFSHARLSELKTIKELEYEIVESKKIIMKNLGVSVDNFAYTFGDIDSFSKQALNIAMKHYKFIYSGLRGSNKKSHATRCIRRDAAANQDSNLNYLLYDTKLLAAFLNGFADFKYSRDLKKLDMWANSLCSSSKRFL